ncbi:hypothetical protein ACFXJ8_38200 [Nonomuraea sp. NPDC059194]|uniref:hypothetical protein n=1 Tax=Nonomuraea sp. NPDC059194 TaxID=3346764 RepID=UPI0036B725CA
MRIDSSNEELVAMFEWACDRALRWAHPAGSRGPLNVDERQPYGMGEGVYLPSYWAGYAHRSGFYLRDFVHQLPGAHLLGLHAANLAMLRCFAASATEEHGHRPVWAFNFDGSYLSIDYRGPGAFVREAPAVYELVEAGAVAYRWTGDRSYVDDPVLWNYYRRAVDLPPTALGTGIFDGTATYNEQDGEPLAVAGDGLAARYAAFLAMAELSRARGLDGDDYERRALDLRRHFAAEWKGVRGFTRDGTPVMGWGMESSWFPALKRLAADEDLLDHIDAQTRGPGRPHNVEAWTYLPDTFFRHGRPETAWRWMREIFASREGEHVAGGRNGDYPEVSFTLVSQVVEGLLGVRPHGAAIVTEPSLPAGVAWLAVSGIPVNGGSVAVRHEGGTTTLTNLSRHVTYTWTAWDRTQRVPPGATASIIT